MLEGYVNLLEIPVGSAAHPPCLQLRPWRGASVRRGGGGGLRAPIGGNDKQTVPLGLARRSCWAFCPSLCVHSGAGMAEDTTGHHSMLPPTA